MSGRNADVIRLFQEELAKYRAYTEYFSQDSGILSISFECLADNQSKDVAELFAVITSSRAS